mgnify:CR=1 FL=1
MTATDLLPRNRREFVILILGAGIALGASSFPGITGITLEPQELTDCRVELAADRASLAACVEDQAAE